MVCYALGTFCKVVYQRLLKWWCFVTRARYNGLQAIVE